MQSLIHLQKDSLKTGSKTRIQLPGAQKAPDPSKVRFKYNVVTVIMIEVPAQSDYGPPVGHYGVPHTPVVSAALDVIPVMQLEQLYLVSKEHGDKIFPDMGTTFTDWMPQKHADP